MRGFRDRLCLWSLLFTVLLISVSGGTAVYGAGKAYVATGRVKILSVVPQQKSVRQYAPLFVDIMVDADYQNPFDPRDIRLDASFTTPSGKTIVVPGFYDGGASSASRWQVRFTPREVGSYRYRLIFISGRQNYPSKRQVLRVTAGDLNGFLQPSDSLYTFRFDSGKPFRGISLYQSLRHFRMKQWLNRGVIKDKRVFEGNAYLVEKFKESGINFTRQWLGWPPWDIASNLTKEANLWKPPKNHIPMKPGVYNLSIAGDVDSEVTRWEDNSIYWICCMSTFHSIDNHAWKRHPYNVANGGPCAKSSEYFTNSEARRLFKQRIRYMVARWSYSPNLAIWELWNEVDIVEKISLNDITGWHREMGDYLREIDPYNRMCSTSLSGITKVDKLWNLPQIDVTQAHSYNISDTAAAVYEYSCKYTKRYNKPFLIGEFGTSERVVNHGGDRGWQNLHAGLWASYFSPTPVTAMNWFREEILKDNAWGDFKALDAYSKGIFETEEAVQTLDIPNLPLQRVGQRVLNITPLRSHIMGAWEKPKVYISIDPVDGRIHGHSDLVNQRHAKTRPFVFKAEFEEGGSFSAHLSKAMGTIIRKEGVFYVGIWIDRKLVLRLPINAETVKEVKRDKDGKAQTYILDRWITVPVPPGKHKIIFGDTRPKKNKDHYYYDIDAYAIRGAKGTAPNGDYLRFYGFSKGGNLYFWAKRSNTDWKTLGENGLPVATVAMPFTLQDVPRGRYLVEWWDTRTGKIIKSENAVSDGSIQLMIPPLTTDIAAKILVAKTNVY